MARLQCHPRAPGCSLLSKALLGPGACTAASGASSEFLQQGLVTARWGFPLPGHPSQGADIQGTPVLSSVPTCLCCPALEPAGDTGAASTSCPMLLLPHTSTGQHPQGASGYDPAACALQVLWVLERDWMKWDKAAPPWHRTGAAPRQLRAGPLRDKGRESTGSCSRFPHL